MFDPSLFSVFYIFQFLYVIRLSQQPTPVLHITKSVEQSLSWEDSKLVTRLPHVVEHKGLLLCSQQSATCPCTEPDQSSPCSHIPSTPSCMKMPHPIHSLWYHPNNIWWDVKITNLLIMLFSLVLCCMLTHFHFLF